MRLRQQHNKPAKEVAADGLPFLFVALFAYCTPSKIKTQESVSYLASRHFKNHVSSDQYRAFVTQ
jgi:hypothetical protein